MPDEKIRDFFLQSAEDSLACLETENKEILYVYNVMDTRYPHIPAAIVRQNAYTKRIPGNVSESRGRD